MRAVIVGLCLSFLCACGGTDAGDASADAALDAVSDTDSGAGDVLPGPDADVSTDVDPADGSSDPSDVAPDITAPDATEPDTIDPDSVDPDIVEPDTTEPDVTEPDTVDPDVVEPDTTEPDTIDPTDVTDPDASACSFLDLDIAIVQCGDGYGYVRRWSDFERGDEACVPYWTITGNDSEFPTLEEAVNAAGCAAECQYRASVSVSLIYCGRRTGYIEYASPVESCGSLFEFPAGLYTSVEAHNAANPCE
jgi:hypothetical protein